MNTGRGRYTLIVERRVSEKNVDRRDKEIQVYRNCPACSRTGA